MNNNNNALGLGLVGCGETGRLCLQAYSQIENIRPIAVADTIHKDADIAAQEFGLHSHYFDLEELILRDDIRMVHFATPPFSHYGLGMMTANEGKHALCEAPLAVSVEEADALLNAAKENNVIMPVNFVLRHTPISEAVKSIIDSQILGYVLHATLENYATDERFSPDHWFWNNSMSGGIFIAHGVHFFDLYEWWLGSGKVISAHAEVRPGTKQEDRVMCTVRHDNGALVSHYHSFDQPERLENTFHRILFEKGVITIEGWLPQTLTINAIGDEENITALVKSCPGCNIETIESYKGSQQACRARGKQITATRIVKIRYTAEPVEKQAQYLWATSDLMTDQLHYIADHSHQRRVVEENGRTSLTLAVKAAELAAAK
ncbi:MAG: Gfo/Idh/MocA family oxidoreductase [Methylococcales bacterium]